MNEKLWKISLGLACVVMGCQERQSPPAPSHVVERPVAQQPVIASSPATAPTTPTTATTPATTQAVTERPSAVVPSEEDHALFEKMNAAIKEADAGETPAREMANLSREGMHIAPLRALGSTQPVSPDLLDRGRWLAQHIVTQIAVGLKLPPAPPLNIAKADGPITIDGKLDEPAWQNAKVIPLAYQYSEKAKGDIPQVRVLWDQNYLYAAYEVKDEQIVAPEIPRDGQIYNYDCVEIFILSDPKASTYWELNISPTGCIFDSLAHKLMNNWGNDGGAPNNIKDLKFAKVVRGTPNQPDDVDEGYTIELAFPLAELPGEVGAGGWEGKTVKMLIACVDSDRPGRSPVGLYTQVPLVGWFHNTWAYQPATFVPRDAKASPTTKAATTQP